MKKVDRYPELGEKVRVLGDEDALVSHVRATWPGAWMEGSTGPERTWWTADKDAPGYGEISGIGACIGHSWPRQSGGYWLRMVAKAAIGEIPTP